MHNISEFYLGNISWTACMGGEKKKSIKLEWEGLYFQEFLNPACSAPYGNDSSSDLLLTDKE